VALTVAEAQTRLDQARADLRAAGLAQSYAHGPNQVQRADYRALEQAVARAARDLREAEAAAAGAKGPGAAVATWT